MATRFPVEDYHDQSKTQIAQELANWFVNRKIAVPVYMDRKGSRRVYYRFKEGKGCWDWIDEKKIESMAKEQIGNQWTRHTRQEFLNQIRSHQEYVHFDDLGLPENEVLLRDKKVLNLETREVRIIQKNDYALNMIDADVNQDDVDISKFLEFLRSTLPEEDHRKTFQEFLGWALKYPNGDYEKLLLILGETDSGKSTLLQIVSKLFEHAQTSNISLTQLAHGRAFHVNHLARSILNIDQDMSSAELESSERLKKLVSQEIQFVEPKGESGFEINPISKIMVASNVAPNPEVSNDKALYNRFVTLESPNSVPKEDQDKHLVDKLTTPEMLSGIFYWALEGLERLESQGRFTYSPSIPETRDKWDKYGSDIYRFIDECVEIKKGSNIPTTDVYEHYEIWSMEEMGDTVSRQEFISALEEHPKMNKERKRTKDGTRRMCFSNIEINR